MLASSVLSSLFCSNRQTCEEGNKSWDLASYGRVMKDKTHDFQCACAGAGEGAGGAVTGVL